MRLFGQHVLVTGGANGIGAAIVQKCVAEGAKVSVFDIDPAGAALEMAEIAFFVADVTKSAEIATAHEAAVARLGPVTGLVNNAGRDIGADPVAMSEAEWDDFFALDLKSAWLVARAVLPGMIAAKAGRIVNIASIHADLTYPASFPYAAAKSGLVGLTRSLALEVGPHNIRVNALSPGYVETALVADFFAQNPPGLREQVLAAHPLGRMGQPAEIAHCVAFLLSDDASFVTGANWRVDGGLGVRFAG